MNDENVRKLLWAMADHISEWYDLNIPENDKDELVDIIFDGGII